MPSIWAAQQFCGLLLKHFHSAKMVCPDPEISLSGTEIFPFPLSKDHGIEELVQQLRVAILKLWHKMFSYLDSIVDYHLKIDSCGI